MTVVSTPTETTTPAKAEAKPDLRAEMIATLQGSDAEGEAEATGDVAEDGVVESQGEDTSDSQEASSNEDAKDEDTNEDESDKPKKPNRYQRLKAKVDATSVLAQKASAERDDAVRIANLYRNRALALEKRLTEELTRARQVGYETSPLADENFTLNLKLQEQQLERQIAEQQAKQRAEQQVEADKQEMAAQFQEQALSITSRMGLSGDDARDMAVKILRGYAIAQRAGEDVSLNEVAQTLAAVSQQRKQSAALKQQAKANAGAPHPIKSASGGIAPDYNSSRDGMIAFLKSLNG